MVLVFSRRSCSACCVTGAASCRAQCELALFGSRDTLAGPKSCQREQHLSEVVLTLLVVNLCAGLPVQEAVETFVTLRDGLICDYSGQSQCR